YADEQRAWIEWARALVSQGRRLVAIVATHHHEDHVGGLEVLAQELGAPVWAHDLTASRLAPQTRALVQRRLCDGDVIVLDGPRPESWRVLHTPGHAPGHVCLFEERTRTVVVGDMVASVGTILIAPGDGDMQIYLEQLDRLAALDASLALPAHGDPIDEPTMLFRKYVAHRLAREAKVLEAVRSAGHTGGDAAALVPDAYADTPVHLWPIAKLSLEMHLEKLEREGRITRVTEGDAKDDGPARAATFRVV
ncbi:MAG: Metallo-beta-lactamase family protein, partial [Myxococcaceae bacterium]|nr:Metallo-beta-lactamase family protein [Myxococcaceae bacterium]